MAQKVMEEIVENVAKLSIQDFCELCTSDMKHILELVNVGILEPEGAEPPQWRFTLYQVQRYKKAQRLQHDLNINWQGVALSLELLDQIEQLETRIQDLEHMLKLAKL